MGLYSVQHLAQYSLDARMPQKGTPHVVSRKPRNGPESTDGWLENGTYTSSAHVWALGKRIGA